MKKVLLCMVIVLAAFAAFGCGSDNNSEQQEKAADWKINTDYSDNYFPKDAKEAFGKFKDEINDELVPVAYFGYKEDKEDQEKTYGYLAYNKTDKELQTISIEINKYDKADVGDMLTFDITKYVKGDGASKSVSERDGFVLPEECGGTVMPEEVQNIFMSSAKTLDGMAMTGLAYLGSQEENGMNYAVLGVSETISDDPVKNVVIAVVNKNKKEKCSFVNINTLDLEEMFDGDDDGNDDEDDD